MTEEIINGKVTTYLWTDLIGPSVFLAETTSHLAHYLHTDYKKNLKVLDLFSGTGAVTIAILHKFNLNTEKVSIVCVDNNFIPLSKQLTKRVIKVKENIIDLIHNNCSFFNQDFDIIVADPPHYLTLDLLYSIVGDQHSDEREEGLKSPQIHSKPFLQYLSELGSIFVLYYAHKEQERLSFFIIRRLGMFWPQVYNLTIGDEKLAICLPTNYVKSSIKDCFINLQTSLKKEYNVDEFLVMDKYNEKI